MIGDPVALTIRQNIDRHSGALIERFSATETSFVCDAMNGQGALHHAIKPIDAGSQIVGSAVTAMGGPRDNLAAMAVLDHVEPGDVVVISTGGDQSGAVIGDNYALIAKSLGAVAIVTDGLVRDAKGIAAAGMPIFALGLAPNAGYPTGPGEVNLPITMGGGTISPGDIVIGDDDGIVIVPHAQASAVADQLDRVREAEAKLSARIRNGEMTKLWNPAKFPDGAVRVVD